MNKIRPQQQFKKRDTRDVSKTNPEYKSMEEFEEWV